MGPARAFNFCRAKRGNQSEFRSKKVRTSFSNCDQSRHFKFSGERACSLAPPEFIPHSDAGAGLASQKALPSCAFSATAGKYFGIKSKGRTNSNSAFRESKRRFGIAKQFTNEICIQFFPFLAKGKNTKQVFNPAL